MLFYVLKNKDSYHGLSVQTIVPSHFVCQSKSFQKNLGR